MVSSNFEQNRMFTRKISVIFVIFGNELDRRMLRFDSHKVTLGHYLLKNTFCFSWISSSVAFLTKFRCIVVLIIPINWVPRHAQASSFALTAVTLLFELSIYGNILEINCQYVDRRRIKMDQNVNSLYIANLLGFESFFIVIL